MRCDTRASGTVFRRLTTVLPSSLGNSREYEITYSGPTSATRFVSGITYMTRAQAIFGFAPFGNLATGNLAEHWGLSFTIGLSAVVALVLFLVIFAVVPRLRHMS